MRLDVIGIGVKSKIPAKHTTWSDNFKPVKDETGEMVVPTNIWFRREEDIKAWFDQFRRSQHANYALKLVRSDLFVIDIDEHGGEASGLKSWRIFIQWLHDNGNTALVEKLNKCIIIKTPSGGYHIYVVTDGTFDIPKGVTGKGEAGGIDLLVPKSSRYVMGEGSMINGKRYVRFTGVDGEPVDEDKIHEDEFAHVESSSEVGTQPEIYAPWRMTKAEMDILREGLGIASAADTSSADGQEKKKLLPVSEWKQGNRNEQAQLNGLNIWSRHHTDPDVENKVWDGMLKANAAQSDPLPEAEVKRVYQSVVTWKKANPEEKFDSAAAENTIDEIELIPLVRKKVTAPPINMSNFGLVGQLVAWPNKDLLTEEIDPNGLLFCLKECFATIVGPEPRHSRNFMSGFVALVGASGSTKGTTTNLAIEMISERYSQFGDRNHITQAINSGEGLISQLQEHDTFGPAQKLWTEEEMVRKFQVGNRQGSTSDADITKARDGRPMGIIVKGSVLTARNFSLSCIANITPNKVKQHVTYSNAEDGSQNRWQWVHVEKAHLLMNSPEWKKPFEYYDDIKTFIDFALCVKDNEEKRWSYTSQADEFIQSDEVRAAITSNDEGIVGLLTTRFRQFLYEYSFFFAAQDVENHSRECGGIGNRCVTQVDVPHIKNALGVLNYNKDSLNLYFGKKTINNDMQIVIDNWPEGRDTITRVELNRDIFNKNRKATALDDVITDMVAKDMIEEFITRNTGGRRVIHYKRINEVINRLEMEAYEQ